MESAQQRIDQRACQWLSTESVDVRVRVCVCLHRKANPHTHVNIERTQNGLDSAVSNCSLFSSRFVAVRINAIHQRRINVVLINIQHLARYNS